MTEPILITRATKEGSVHRNINQRMWLAVEIRLKELILQFH